MKISLDSNIVHQIAKDPDSIRTYALIADEENSIVFGWPSLLEYLGCGALLAELPSFEPGTPLFDASISSLALPQEKEVLFYIYDHLFTENLRQIKSLSKIDAPSLLRMLEDQSQRLSSLEIGKNLVSTLISFEEAFRGRPSLEMHDLILYLAWDRMCLTVGKLFDYQSSNPNYINGIEVFRECLIESYSHIVQQGRTRPGAYRMIEALFFYEMREERLQTHTSAEWTMLSKSFPLLKPQNELVDFSYVDYLVVPESEKEVDHESLSAFLTGDEIVNIDLRISLAKFILNKLKEQYSNWNNVLLPQRIILKTTVA